MATDKNPYAKEDGTPKEGLSEEFFKWARERELEKRSELSPEQRKAKEDAEKALSERMDS